MSISRSIIRFGEIIHQFNTRISKHLQEFCRVFDEPLSKPPIYNISSHQQFPSWLPVLLLLNSSRERVYLSSSTFSQSLNADVLSLTLYIAFEFSLVCYFTVYMHCDYVILSRIDALLGKLFNSKINCSITMLIKNKTNLSSVWLPWAYTIFCLGTSYSVWVT